jgi:hypothetical protein
MPEPHGSKSIIEIQSKEDGESIDCKMCYVLFILCHQICPNAVVFWFNVGRTAGKLRVVAFPLYYRILNRISYNEIQFDGLCLSL